MVTILMISAKIATLGLLKIKVSWNKGYDVIIPVYDVANKFLSRYSYYVVDVVMWPKFVNSSNSMREVIITSISKGFGQKNHFIWGVALVQIKYSGTASRYGLEILHQCVEKGLTLKMRQIWRLIPTFVEFKGEICKTDRGDFCFPCPHDLLPPNVAQQSEYGDSFIQVTMLKMLRFKSSVLLGIHTLLDKWLTLLKMGIFGAAHRQEERGKRALLS